MVSEQSNSDHAPADTGIEEDPKALNPRVHFVGNVLDRLVTIISSAVLSIFAARYSQDLFGIFASMLAITSVIVVTANSGLHVIVQQETPVATDLRGLVRSALKLRFVSGALGMTAAIFIALFWVEDDRGTIMLLLLAAKPLVQGGEIFAFVRDGQARVWPVVVVRAVVGILSTAAVIVIFWSRARFEWFAVIPTLETLALSVCFYVVRPKEALLKRRSREQTSSDGYQWRVRGLVRRAWPLAVSSLAVVIYTRCDQVMLAMLTTNTETALYAASVRVSELGYLFPIIGASVIYRHVSIHLDRTRTPNAADFQTLFDVLAALGYLSAVTTALVGPYVLGTLFGNDYLGGVPMIWVHCWSSVFVGLGIARTRWLVLLQRERLSMLCVCVGATCNLLLNMVLIPRFGGIGAAIATTLASAIGHIPCLAVKDGRSITRTLALSFLLPVRLPWIWRAVVGEMRAVSNRVNRRGFGS